MQEGADFGRSRVELGQGRQSTSFTPSGGIFPPLFGLDQKWHGIMGTGLFAMLIL